MEWVLATAEAVGRALRRVALASGWLFVAATAAIVFDVVSRKFGYQLPGFGSSRLQELEWHLHAALFAFWLGFAYVRDAHVRIDIAVAGLAPRGRALLELLGCALFALPYGAVAFYYCAQYAWIAFATDEASVSASGLSYRFIPKGVVALGLLLLLAAVLSVMARSAVFLFGPARLRARAAGR